jgi:hypothetical protein
VRPSPEIIEEAGRLGWELIGYTQTNALRLTEMDGAQEGDAVPATIDRSVPAWPKPGTRSTIWPKPASAMSATGSVEVSIPGRLGMMSATATVWPACSRMKLRTSRISSPRLK